MVGMILCLSGPDAINAISRVIVVSLSRGAARLWQCQCYSSLVPQAVPLPNCTPAFFQRLFVTSFAVTMRVIGGVDAFV